MREVEINMNIAIENKRNFSQGNTTVRYHADSEISTVQLHGHTIAAVNHFDGSVVVNFCGWETATTRSRLDAIVRYFAGVPMTIQQRNFEQVLFRQYGQGKQVKVEGFKANTNTRIGVDGSIGDLGNAYRMENRNPYYWD